MAEITVFAERRTWTDINDGTKHTDEAAVELYERVREKRQAAPSN